MFNEAEMRKPECAEEIEQEAKRIGFPMSCDLQTGSILRTLAASKPKGKILELGTGAGLSTCWILDGMDHESRLITVEYDESLHAVAKKYLD